MAYFLIENDDGDTRVAKLTKEELVKNLQERVDPEFITDLNEESEDTDYWGDKILVICGYAVSPASDEKLGD
jgi:hypothetical protein